MLEFIEKKVALGDGVVVREKGVRPWLPLDAFAIPADGIEVVLATARPDSELVETCPEWRPLPLVRLVGRWIRQLPVGDRGHGAQHRLGLDGVAQWCGRWRSCGQCRTTAGDHEDGHGGDRQACHQFTDRAPTPTDGPTENRSRRAARLRAQGWWRAPRRCAPGPCHPRPAT